jgi:protein kinase-like protein
MIGSSTNALSPTIDGRFLVLEALGEGGQGRVVRAFDRLERREVAIKVLGSGRGPGGGEALAAEFAAWVRLRHPNVVRVFEIARSVSGPFPSGTPYLVMELVRGLPVHRALPPGRTPDAILEEVARRVLRALDHVHAAGLVHRDLKPGNVLVTPSRRGCGKVKLTDFGLASEAGRRGCAGRISGSLPYVAPEAVLGMPLDGRADLYALGILLFLLSTGRMPLASRTPERWVRWHLQGEPADPRRVRPGMAPRLADLVTRLTTRDRDARLPTAVEALALLGPAGLSRSAGASTSLLPSERAALRFALGAARDGQLREVRVPRRPDAMRAARVEIDGLGAGLGIPVLRLTRPPGSAVASLDRLVMRLLMERGSEVPGLIARHRLSPGLPLTLLEGVPIWIRPDGARRVAHRAGSIHVLARGIAGLVLGAARRRALVLVVDRPALSDPLASAVVARLRRAVASPPSPEGGGLLLVIGDDSPRRRAGRPGAGAQGQAFSASGISIPPDRLP